MKNFWILLLFTPLCFLTFGSLSWAQGTTHPAHVHGVASLNVTIENNTVDIDFDGPLASFISFEHAPSTPAQTNEMKDMATKLRNSAALFVFPLNLGCKPGTVNMEGENIPEDILGHPHAASAHEHGDHDHGDHDHGDHDHGDHDHGDHDHGDHDHGEDEYGEHSDIEVEFSFNCSSLGTSGQVEVALFKVFPNLNELNVQLISPKGQSGVKLTPKDNILKW
ncbi:MAG: DUF2796 domain-containing protein [Deltaproteobacteria bacterium]|jgi:hypothetical protein|nr:DUF2796 domain-containing protein [Deltaproteobacteria bacterium]